MNPNLALDSKSMTRVYGGSEVGCPYCGHSEDPYHSEFPRAESKLLKRQSSGARHLYPCAVCLKHFYVIKRIEYCAYGYLEE